MFRLHPDEHFIEQGRVYCPVRARDVDFDICARCRWARGIDLKSNPPVVRCYPERAPLWLIPPWL